MSVYTCVARVRPHAYAIYHVPIVNTSSINLFIYIFAITVINPPTSRQSPGKRSIARKRHSRFFAEVGPFLSFIPFCRSKRTILYPPRTYMFLCKCVYMSLSVRPYVDHSRPARGSLRVHFGHDVAFSASRPFVLLRLVISLNSR